MRPDVLLWRNSVSPGTFDYRWWSDETSPLTGLSREDLEPIFDACVDSKNPVVFWSALAHAVAMNDPEAKGLLPVDPLEAHRFLTRLCARIETGVARPKDSIVPCAYYHLMAKIRVEAGPPGDNPDHDHVTINRFLDEIDAIIRTLDSNWNVGENIDFRSFLASQESVRFAPRSLYVDHCIMARCLGLLRPIAHGRFIVLAPSFDEAERLSCRVADFAKTSWKVLRSRRLGEQGFLGELVDRDKNARQRLLEWVLFEVNALMHLVNVLRDAGEYLEAGRTSYLITRIIPDGLETDEELLYWLGLKRLPGRPRRATSIMFRMLREVGLDPDPRFNNKDKGGYRPDYQAKWTERYSSRLYDAPLRDEEIIFPVYRAESEYTPHGLRVERDVQSSEDWKEILRWFSPKTYENEIETYGGYLLTVTRAFPDHALPASSRLRLAVFRIALRYGFIRSGGKVLELLMDEGFSEFTAEDIIAFCLKVRDCSLLDPFGMRAYRYVEWQSTMRRVVLSLRENYGSNWLSNGNINSLRYLVHELSINRSHSLIRSIGSSKSHLLYEHFDGTIEAQSAADLYQQKHSLERKVFGLATWEKLADRIEEDANRFGCAAVLTSIFLYGEYASIAALGLSGRLDFIDRGLPDIKAEVLQLKRDACFWFQAAMPFEQQIAWGPNLRMIGQLLSELHDRNGGCGIIKLAAGPDLAGLPWQHLFISLGRPDISVVLIPAWSNTQINTRPPRKEGIELILSSEDSEEIRTVTSAVKSHRQGAQGVVASCGVVVGHGNVSEGSLPEIDLGMGHRLTDDNWLELSAFDVVILHACHGGAAIPIALDQLGGSIGLLLGLGVRSLVAPVSEVRPISAVRLNEELFMNPDREVVTAYREAIKKEPECALYNLYGDPFISLSSN